MSDAERERLVERITDALVEFDREQYEGYTGESWSDCEHRTSRTARVNDAQHAAHAVLRYYAERTQVGDCGNASPGNRLAMSSCGTTSHCTLPFGHEGWHRDARTGSRWGKEWSDPPGGVWESTPAPSIPLDALKAIAQGEPLTEVAGDYHVPLDIVKAAAPLAGRTSDPDVCLCRFESTCHVCAEPYSAVWGEDVES